MARISMIMQVKKVSLLEEAGDFSFGIIGVLICVHAKYNVIVSLSPLFDFAYDLRKKDHARFRVYHSLPL